MIEIYFRGTKLFEFEDSPAIQIMGNNVYLIKIITDVFFKIFDGYRFSDVDIEAMNGYYPEVRQEERALKKNDKLVIKISEIQDLLEQLTINRNSILMKYMLSLNNNIEISESLENIDKTMTELSIIIDELIKEKILKGNIMLKTELSGITLEKVIKSFINLNFINPTEERMPLWLLRDADVIDLFINIIKLILEEEKNTTIIIDRLDSKIELKDYKQLVKKLLDLSEKYSNFKIWLIPSTEAGTLLDFRIFNNTYIINEEIIRLGDFDITYESICRNYPDNNFPSEMEVLNALLKLYPFHSREKEYLPTKEVIIMMIFLELLGKEKSLKLTEYDPSKLEYSFLTGFK